MQYMPWWTDSQKKLAEDARKAVDEVLLPLGERLAWKKQFPWEAIKEMAKLGWFGALIPAKYGGKKEEWGITGACIIMEQVGRAGSLAIPLGTTMIGAIHQILNDGTEEQRKRWLPKIAKGELIGAITMTEPYAGSDVAGMESTAVREGDYYIINGRKRFQSAGAAADIYLTYVKTSDKPEDRAKHRHMTAFVLEKGMPGFSVERVNDLMGMEGVYNVYLNFDNVKVPVANRVGEEGAGWSILISGVNVERLIQGTVPIGFLWECLRYAVQHTERRVQFRKLTGDMTNNQFAIAEIIEKLQIGRLISYYAAYCADLGLEIPLESAIAKLFNTDAAQKASIDAMEVMGGNGVTKYYPIERMLRDTKWMEIAAGTTEIQKIMIYRQGVKLLKDDLKVPHRVIDEELKVPMPVGKLPPRKKVTSEDDILNVLAENYRVNPGLHMSMDDLKELLDISDEDLEKYLLGMEENGLASLYRNRKGKIILARPTNDGINKAHPFEYYKYIPDWVDPGDIF